MFKKILFLFCLTFSTIGFSQKKSLEKLSAAPNPFVTATTISFTTLKDSKITLSVKNVLGKIVYKKEHTIKKGENSIPFYKNNLATGIYIYSIRDTKYIISKRFVIK